MKIRILLLIVSLSAALHAEDFPIEKYVKDLATNDLKQSFRLNDLYTEFRKNDREQQKLILSLIEKRVKQQHDQFLQVRFSYLKLFSQRFFVTGETFQSFIDEFHKSLAMAASLKNEMLIADGCYWYALIMNENQHFAEGLFYNLKSMELVEKLGQEYFYGVNHRYQILGELLYNSREYEKSIYYSKKAIQYDAEKLILDRQISVFNTIGLAYHKQMQLDSALFYFDKSSKLAASLKSDIWVTIPNANKAQILFEQKKYREAMPLFEADYHSSMKGTDYPNAANNLQWMAKIYLAENKVDSAFHYAQQALQLLKSSPQSGYLANTYETLTAIYRQQNNIDSSNHYLQLYNHVHDSIEAAVAISRSEIVQLRLNDENFRNKIELLEKDQQNEMIKRNAFIIFVLLLALIAYLLYNRQQSIQKQQQLLQDAELQAAKEQMKLFTKTIAEKSELMESLNQQLKLHNLDQNVQENLEILKQKTILTENDWEEYQKLFEKIYPQFFDRLRNKNFDITVAELRFASIIRLQMNNKQAGAMLGISPDSARKTRLRLRQRLNLAEDSNLEQYILNI